MSNIQAIAFRRNQLQRFDFLTCANLTAHVMEKDMNAGGHLRQPGEFWGLIEFWR